jgi:polar amino acid transport system ATP-binding protein
VGEVLHTIRDLVREGMTCLLVTHEMQFAEEISDEIYFTEHGVIVEHGPPQQIFRAPVNERTNAFINRSLRRGPATAVSP